MNREDVQKKIDVIADNLEKLSSLAAADYDGFVEDFRNIDSALHRLQTTVQALIDVASYVASSLGLRTPTTSVDVVEVLREAGHIPDDRALVYTKMVQFRNRVVHLYNRISPEMLYRILTTEGGDLRDFRDRLVAIIDAQP